MLKITQGLALQQIQKHSGLVSISIQVNQALNLTEGHHPLDPLFWESIVEDNKVSGVLGA
jgi:hypothetical protein